MKHRGWLVAVLTVATISVSGGVAEAGEATGSPSGNGETRILPGNGNNEITEVKTWAQPSIPLNLLVNCTPGNVAVSGKLAPETSSGIAVTQAGPTDNRTGWGVSLENDNEYAVKLTYTVVCEKPKQSRS